MTDENFFEEKYFFHLLNLNFHFPNKEIFDLFQKFKSFKKTFEFLKTKITKFQSEEELIKELKENNIEIITFNDQLYPKTLKNIPDPPLGIYCRGDIKLLDSFCLAIVGTRKATKQGKLLAYQFASSLAKIGISIVSGLAFGIDENAHKGAIDVGGRTIGVLGTGIKLALKEKNLASKVNLLISEFLPEAPGLKHHFPLRNRIIAAISKGTLVIEAPMDSGALITARLALEYGKDLFVVPGDIWNINYAGSNMLLKQGAILVTCPEDILQEYGIKIKEEKLNLTEEEKELLKIIKENKLEEINEIIKFSNLDIGRVLAIISSLELKGIIKNISGKIKIL